MLHRIQQGKSSRDNIFAFLLLSALKELLQHIIIWLVALSILNSSIGIPDMHPADFANNNGKAMLNLNEYESIYEWVAEEVLQIKNAVPEEKDKHGNEHSILKKHAPVYVTIRLQKSKLQYIEGTHAPLPATEIGAQRPLAGFITLFSPPPDLS